MPNIPEPAEDVARSVEPSERGDQAVLFLNAVRRARRQLPKPCRHVACGGERLVARNTARTQDARRIVRRIASQTADVQKKRRVPAREARYRLRQTPNCRILRRRLLQHGRKWTVRKKRLAGGLERRLLGRGIEANIARDRRHRQNSGGRAGGSFVCGSPTFFGILSAWLRVADALASEKTHLA